MSDYDRELLRWQEQEEKLFQERRENEMEEYQRYLEKEAYDDYCEQWNKTVSTDANGIDYCAVCGVEMKSHPVELCK